MPHVSRASQRRIVLFAAVFLLSLFLNILSQLVGPLQYSSSVMYSVLLIAWAVTVQRRVLQVRLRRCLIAAAMLLISLFVLRFCRWELFAWSIAADRFIWLLYYIPYIAVPLLSLCAALCIGSGEDGASNKTLWSLWGVCGLLVSSVMTNELHHSVFRVINEGGGYTVEYRWLYYIIVAWCVMLTIAAFWTLMHRCRLSQCRRLWYVPLLTTLLGIIPLAVYYAGGGASPTLAGIKLYQQQEGFALLFVALWEGCIQIGLIPSNSDYDALFRLSHLSAALADGDGRIVYRAADHPGAAGSDIVQREQAVSGGKIVWIEDRSNINTLNAKILEATELLEEENILIEQENQVRAEKLRYEEQNRLYDKIAETVRPQLAALEALFRKTGDDASFRQDLAYGAVLGAYIKRRANLELLADQSPVLSTEELAYAIRESFEYLTISGFSCELRHPVSADVPSPLLLLAYGLFEAVAERVYPLCHSFGVLMEQPFSLTLALDTAEPLIDPDWERQALSAMNAGLTVTVEDDTTYVRLSAGEGASV